jgi:DNA-binding SARP family transcriptional activator
MERGRDADVSVHRRVGVLGGLGVYPAARLSLPARRLIAYLGVKRHAVTRTVGASELWPEIPDECARANLRRALWHLPTGWISTVGEDLILEATSDLHEAYDLASRALGGEALSFSEITLLSEDLLPGWHEEWVLQAQEAFRLLRVQALEAACRTMTRAASFALATQAGAAALAAEPLRESAAAALIEAHLAQRNRHEAVQCFRSLARRLKHELGVEPDPALAERIEFSDQHRALVH